MGNVLQAGQGQAPARQAVLGAGIHSLDTGVKGFLSSCRQCRLCYELKQSDTRPFVKIFCVCFFSVMGEVVCCTHLSGPNCVSSGINCRMHNECYCLQCLQSLEKTILETRLLLPEHLVLMMHAALRIFLETDVFLQCIVTLKPYGMRGQWVSLNCR